MILERLSHFALNKPNKTALIYNSVRFRYCDLARMIEGVRLALDANSLPPGSRIVILTDHMLKAWLSILAARALGFSTIILPHSNMILDMQLRDVAAIFSTPEEMASKLGALMRPCPVIFLEDAFIQRTLDVPFDRLNFKENTDSFHAAITSGTTGVPKAVPFYSHNEMAMVQALNSAFEMGLNFTYNALNRSVFTGSVYKHCLATWCAGGTVILDQRSNLFDSMRNGKQLVSVPQRALRVLEQTNRNPRIKNNEATIRLGGGTNFNRVLLIKKLLSNRLIGSFGSTEIILPQLQNELNSPEDVIWLKPYTPGRIEIVDADGNAVPVGEQGLLRTKLYPYDPQAYLDDPETSSKVFREGYYYPGDLAVMRADGRVKILGRASDVLIAKTMKFPTAFIERSFLEKFKAREVYMFSHRDDEGQDILFVAMLCDDVPDLGKMRSFLFHALEEAFEEIVFFPLSSFPRLPNGKIDKISLRNSLLREASGS